MISLQREPIEEHVESLYKIIELTIHTPEWLAREHPSKRCVDNQRPVNRTEQLFLDDIRQKEIVLMKGRFNMTESLFPTSSLSCRYVIEAGTKTSNVERSSAE